MLGAGGCGRDDVTSGLEQTARLESLLTVFRSFFFFFSLVRVHNVQGRDAASYFSLVSTRRCLFRHCFRFLAYLPPHALQTELTRIINWN